MTDIKKRLQEEIEAVFRPGVRSLTKAELAEIVLIPALREIERLEGLQGKVADPTCQVETLERIATTLESIAKTLGSAFVEGWG